MSKKPSNKVKMTPMEKELTRINYESMQRYRQKYMPLEAKFVGDVMGSQKKSIDMAENEAAGSSQFAFERNAPVNERVIGGTGGDLGSGRGLALRADANTDLATSRAGNVVNAGMSAKDAYYRNLGTLVAQGKGKEVEALRTGSEAAGLANKQAIIDAQAAQGARMARNQLIGTGVGYAAGAGIDYMNQPAKPISTWTDRKSGLSYSAEFGDQPVVPEQDYYGLTPQFTVGN